MKVTPTRIPDVLILEPKVFEDSRGFFLESYNRRAFKQATGLDPDFVQDNESFSARNVLRGLHYQVHQPQGKLITAIRRVSHVLADAIMFHVAKTAMPTVALRDPEAPAIKQSEAQPRPQSEPRP